MKNQSGSTLVVSLILLTIITLVTVYLLEGTTLQSKMIVNSLASRIAYQDCRNEQEANVRIYNEDRTLLVQSIDTTVSEDSPLRTSQTMSYSEDKDQKAPQSESIEINWNYIGDKPASRGGYNIDSESPSTASVFEHTCTAVKNAASNSQLLGATVDVLQQAGVTN